MSYQIDELNPTWTDEPLHTTTRIKKIHIEEIRYYLEQLTNVTGCLKDYSGYFDIADIPHDSGLNSGFHNGRDVSHHHNENANYHNQLHSSADNSEKVTYHNGYDSTYRGSHLSGNFSSVHSQYCNYRQARVYHTHDTCPDHFISRYTSRRSNVYTSVQTVNFSNDNTHDYSNENTPVLDSRDVMHYVNERLFHNHDHKVRDLSSYTEPEWVKSCVYNTTNLQKIRSSQAVACQTYNMSEYPNPCPGCSSYNACL